MKNAFTRFIAITLCAIMLVLSGCDKDIRISIKNPASDIKIDSVARMELMYLLAPEENNNYCKVEADFEQQTITVRVFTEVFEYLPVSGSDEMETVGKMEEQSQSFTDLDMSSLEQYVIENNDLLFVNDYAYDLTEMDGHKTVCKLDVQTGDHKLYHAEGITRCPAGWDGLVDEIIKASGVTIIPTPTTES